MAMTSASSVAFFLVFCGLNVAADRVEASLEVLGIGGAGGMYAPAVSPDDPNLMFVACDMGGDYRSTDGGQHWAMIHHNQLNSSRTCRPLFLKDAIIWVSGATLKISGDKGASWQPLLSGPTPWKGQVVRMAADMTDSHTVLAGTDAGELWRSTDTGKTWDLSYQGQVHAITGLGEKFFAAVGGKLLASRDHGRTWEEVVVPEARGQDFLSLTGGVAGRTTILYGQVAQVGTLQSLDKGKSWKVVDEFRGCNEVLMAANQTRVAYTAQTGHSGARFIFRTRDTGQTWESCFRMDAPRANVEKSWVQTELRWGYYITDLGLGVSPTDPQVAFVSTQGDFYLTRDGGETWRQLMNVSLGRQSGDPGPRYQCNGLEVTSCWDYLFDPCVKGRAYIAYTDIGFARSVDGGKTWSWSAKGCPWANTFYQVVFDPYTKGKLYAATSSRHDIPQWTHVEKNSPGQEGGVCVSEDGGLTWKVLGTGLPKLPCTSICIDPKSTRGSLTLYATLFEGGCYKSTDNGRTWVDKSKDLGNPGNLHAYRVSVHPKTGAVFCSITGCREGNRFPVPGGLWKSADGGEHWTNLTRDLNLHWLGAFALHPENPDLIYLTAATIPGGREGGLYRTTNGGDSWKRLLKDEDFAKTGGVGYVQCFFVNLHPQKPDHVYLGTASHGLWFSLDAGLTWSRFEALPFRSVTNVRFDPEEPESMYVCTFGGGVWRVK